MCSFWPDATMFVNGVYSGKSLKTRFWVLENPGIWCLQALESPRKQCFNVCTNPVHICCFRRQRPTAASMFVAQWTLSCYSVKSREALFDINTQTLTTEPWARCLVTGGQNLVKTRNASTVTVLTRCLLPPPTRLCFCSISLCAEYLENVMSGSWWNFLQGCYVAQEAVD